MVNIKQNIASEGVLDSPPVKPRLESLPPSPDERVSSLDLPSPVVLPFVPELDQLPSIVSPSGAIPRTSSPLLHETSSAESPLFLAIDSGSRRMRACVFDCHLRPVWVEQVSLDIDLPEYGTLNGVYTAGSRVSAPSEQRLAALDLLLTRLAFDSPNQNLLSRVRAISGACQANAHVLSHAFDVALSTISDQANLGLAELFPAHQAFAVPVPKTLQDETAIWHETAFGSASSIIAVLDQLLSEPHAQDDPSSDSDDMSAFESSRLPIHQTARVCLESVMLTSILTGTIVASTLNDACATGFCRSIQSTASWDLDCIEAAYHFLGNQSEAGKGGHWDCLLTKVKLIELLGPVVCPDDKEETHFISAYFVERFGFNPDCIVVSFSSDTYCTLSAFDLKPSDAILCLGPSDCDTLIFKTAPQPAEQNDKPWQGLHQTDSLTTGLDSPPFAVICNHNASVARSLTRDLACNGEWSIFARLVALVPHGGSIGLDNKYFSLFFPSAAPASHATGFNRFSSGTRVADFPDRKVNPRLLLESQLLDLRVRYSEALRIMSSETALVDGGRPMWTLDWHESPLPKRLILTGGAAQNPAIVSLAATVFNCPSYFLDDTTELAQIDDCACDRIESALSLQMGDKFWTRQSRPSLDADEQNRSGVQPKTTTSALGAGYLAAHAYAKHHGWPQTRLHDMHYDVTGSRSPVLLDMSDSDLSLHQFVNFVKRNRTSNCPTCKIDTIEHDDENHGLTLVATPDPEEHRYYTSMIPEFVRLQHNARKGFI